MVKLAPNSPWGPTQTAYLVANWGKQSTLDIAASVGITKNGVVGKAHRMGLPNLGNPVGAGDRSQHTPSARVPYRPAAIAPKGQGRQGAKPGAPNPGGILMAALSRAAAPKPVLVPPVPPVPFTGKPVRQIDIGAHHCRWIVGNERGGAEALMCGRDRDGESVYCSERRARSTGGLAKAESA